MTVPEENTINYARPTMPPRMRYQPSPEEGSVWLWVLRLMAWAFFGLIALAILGGALSFGVPGIGPAFGFILGLLVLVAAATYYRNRRRSDAITILGYLAQAVRLNLPLPAMLHAAELAERARVRKRLTGMRMRINAGEATGAALQWAAPGLPQRVIDLVRAAERTGQLPAALERLTRHEHQHRRQPMRDIYVRWYPVATLALFGIGMTMLAIFVMPKFEEIFHDFKLKFPPITALVLGVWREVWWIFFAAAAVTLCLFCGQMFVQVVAPRMAGAGPVRRWMDAVLWHVPALGTAIRSRALADVFNVAADALSAGAPLDRALADAMLVARSQPLKVRVATWAALVATGRPVGESAREARMPHLVCGMVGAAVTTARAVEVFRFLARYYESRFSRMAVLLEGAAVPAVAIVFGLIVGSVVLGLMLPLIEMIDHLTTKAFY